MKKILFFTLLIVGAILFADVPSAEVLSQKFQQRLKSGRFYLMDLCHRKLFFRKKNIVLVI
jgi:hypothetical protein